MIQGEGNDLELKSGFFVNLFLKPSLFKNILLAVLRRLDSWCVFSSLNGLTYIRLSGGWDGSLLGRCWIRDSRLFGMDVFCQILCRWTFGDILHV